MAVRTTEEILESIKTRVGDSTEDADLKFLEDVTDTLSDLRSKSEGQEDWKAKYEENDKQWREKYRDRFLRKKKNRKRKKKSQKHQKHLKIYLSKGGIISNAT